MHDQELLCIFPHFPLTFYNCDQHVFRSRKHKLSEDVKAE